MKAYRDFYVLLLQSFIEVYEGRIEKAERGSELRLERAFEQKSDIPRAQSEIRRE